MAGYAGKGKGNACCSSAMNGGPESDACTEPMVRAEWIDHNGRRVARLTCGAMVAEICPEIGMNVVRIAFNGIEWIDFDEARHAAGATTGMPILFPTPNRVRGDEWIFNGKRVPARMHGFARLAPFAPIRLQAWKRGERGEAERPMALVEAELAISMESPWHELLPYPCVLNVCVRVTPDALEHRYRLRNTGSEPLPFGFGLHPFFRRNGTDVRVAVLADAVMPMDGANLPFGRAEPVSGTTFDLRAGAGVDSLRLDHVYTQVSVQPAAVHEGVFLVENEASPDFGHMVVYTPEGREWYCIENQTCSTDAHNLHAAGFVRESGLQIVPPGDEAGGFVRWRFLSARQTVSHPA